MSIVRCVACGEEFDLDYVCEGEFVETLDESFEYLCEKCIEIGGMNNG